MDVIERAVPLPIMIVAPGRRSSMKEKSSPLAREAMLGATFCVPTILAAAATADAVFSAD